MLVTIDRILAVPSSPGTRTTSPGFSFCFFMLGLLPGEIRPSFLALPYLGRIIQQYWIAVTRLNIHHLGELIATCWSNAEEGLQELVKAKYPDRDEEYITDLFHGELENRLNTASDNGQVASAFLRDLKQAFPDFSEESLDSNISRGLVATVSFHSAEVERKTGGDLGIVLIRPDIQLLVYSQFSKTGYERGLLCQAKIFRRDSRWGLIGTKQSRSLAEYVALLLYRYTDQAGERRELAPFAWQLGRGATIPQMNGWLRTDKFPKLQNSQQILSQLADDTIGTDDPRIIGEDIAPGTLRPSLVIEVRWRKNDDPGERIYVHRDSTEAHQQKLYVRR